MIRKTIRKVFIAGIRRKVLINYSVAVALLTTVSPKSVVMDTSLALGVKGFIEP